MTSSFRSPPAGFLVVTLGLLVLGAAVVLGHGAAPRAWSQQALLLAVVFTTVVLGESLEVTMPSGRRLAPLSLAAGLSAVFLGEVDGGPSFDVHPGVLVLVFGAAQVAAMLIRRVLPTLAPRTRSGASTAAAARLVGVATAAVFVRCPFGEGRTLWAWSTDGRTPPLAVAAAFIAVGVGGLVIERVLAGAARARREHGLPRAVFREEVTEAAPLTVALVMPAPMAALVAPVIGVAAIPLALLPLLLISFTVGLYAAIGETFRQTVRTLSRLTEEGGYTPRRHAERVAELSRAVAVRLGVTARDVRTLEFAALLHDLGQLGLRAPIPAGATVLAAPHDQLALARDGATVISHNADLRPVAAVVEGQATPYRSVVEYAVEVPLTSRILKVANAFDDLTGGARTPAAMTAALERMHLGLGYEYDPEVVIALEQVVAQRWSG